jgi:hypothetical protein
LEFSKMEFSQFNSLSSFSIAFFKNFFFLFLFSIVSLSLLNSFLINLMIPDSLRKENCLLICREFFRFSDSELPSSNKSSKLNMLVFSFRNFYWEVGSPLLFSVKFWKDKYSRFFDKSISDRGYDADGA